MSAHSLLTISNAAKVSGLSPATLRRLDDRLKPTRSEGGFRLYEFDAVMDYVAGRKRGSRRRPWIDRVFCQSSASMPQIPDESVDLIVTSPPFAGRRGGVDPDQYVEWFSPFAAECHRVMKRHANFVLVIKECAIGGVRHQYIHDLVRDLTTDGFDWIDEFVWSKPCPLPKKPRDSLKDGWERCYVFGINGVRDRMFFPNQVRRPLKPHHNTAPRARTTAGGFTFAAESFTDLPGRISIQCPSRAERQRRLPLRRRRVPRRAGRLLHPAADARLGRLSTSVRFPDDHRGNAGEGATGPGVSVS